MKDKKTERKLSKITGGVKSYSQSNDKMKNSLRMNAVSVLT